MTTFEDIVSHLHASQPVPKRMRAIFGLKSLNTKSSIEALEKSLLSDPSALVRHEIAYVLGQMESKRSIPTLRGVLRDETEDVMVRHEAGEALGAIGEESELGILEEYSSKNKNNKNLDRAISETCDLAIERILCNKEKKQQVDNFGTIDPAIPDKEEEIKCVEELKSVLSNHHEHMTKRYKALFALRNQGGKDAILALCYAMESEQHSALLKHEIAYVLGQIADACAIDSLRNILMRGQNEADMVRHEAAEALGAIATEEAESILKKYQRDKDTVVRESVQVALDIADYVTDENGQIDYADTLPKNVRDDIIVQDDSADKDDQGGGVKRRNKSMMDKPIIAATS